jgi:enoyl-CoA hydratase
VREELIVAFGSLQDQEDVRAIVLTARGDVFCAGADIREKDALLTEGTREGGFYNRLIRDTFFSVLESRKPVMAAVNGAAAGAGFVLAACCDLIVAADTAFFAMPEVDVGLGGGASFLLRVLPRTKVHRMVLTGERVSATELYRLGAVEECVGGSEVVPRALAMAAEIAAKSPLATRAIKSSLMAVEELGLHQGFLLEERYSNELSRSAYAAEARRAFLERRRPVF